MTAATADGPLVSAAVRRPRATVGLDLRLAGRAAAVAVDGKGALAAWAVVDEAGNDPVALARRAVLALAVRALGVRVLLGPPQAQVGLLARHDASGASPVPAEREILEALYAEGYERLLEPSTAALFLVGEGHWLVAAAGANTVQPLADELLAASGAAPDFVVDQLFVKARLERGTPGTPGTLPTLGGRSLPAECELAWRLALGAAVPSLDGPRLAARRQSLLWARRLTWAALAMALLGVVLMLAGLGASWTNRGKNRALAATTSGVAKQMAELQKIGAQAEEVGRLRAELAGLTGPAVPFPRLAEAVAGLARELPPGVGWDKLKVTDGTLELAAAASGPGAVSRLASLRQALERSPVVVNLSWTAPVADAQGPGVRQTFRANLREP